MSELDAAERAYHQGVIDQLFSRRGLFAFGAVAASGLALADVAGVFGAPPASASGIAWNYPMTSLVTEFDPIGGTRDHTGQDYANGLNFSIYSIAAGKVVAVQNDGPSASVFGNYVKIDHGKNDAGDHFQSYYGHMQSEPVVKKGQVLLATTLLGKAGNTKGSYTGTVGTHLHLSVLKNGDLIDPRPIVNNKPLAGSPTRPTHTPDTDADPIVESVDEGDEMRLMSTKDASSNYVYMILGNGYWFKVSTLVFSSLRAAGFPEGDYMEREQWLYRVKPSLTALGYVESNAPAFTGTVAPDPLPAPTN